MPFCSNCGQKIDANAKFCSGCGAKTAVQTSNNAASNTTSNVTRNTVNNSGERRTVYEGEIRKCPNCGEIIDTFTARCPACGFELNNKKVSAVLQNFINEINECERSIENSPTAGKTGWASWGKGKRF